MMACSAPADCAEIERRHATGIGLLVDGGASRGNLLSGEADETILTVSRTEAEKRANPGYRAFLANGFNVTRALVLFGWEVVLEITAAIRAARRDIRPRGHRGGIYPLMRGAMCVIVRDLVVFGVLTDMMRGRPAVYATFASYDEVAHHSGLDAPTPWRLCGSSTSNSIGWRGRAGTHRVRTSWWCSRTTDRRRVRPSSSETATGSRSSSSVRWPGDGFPVCGRRRAERDGPARGERSHRAQEGKAAEERRLGSRGGGARVRQPRARLSDGGKATADARRDRRASPQAGSELREHPHIGWLLVRSAEHGAVVLGAAGAHYLDEGRIDGDDPLAAFAPTAARHLQRTDRFPHVADIMVGSFYDPELDEGCAFEELISFHGGLGGPQTRPFILCLGEAAAAHGADHRGRRGARAPLGLESNAPDAGVRHRADGPAVGALSLGLATL